MIIISNTGPLIGLAKIQQLRLLELLATEIYASGSPLLENLRNAGYWISDELVAVVKKLAAE